MKHRSRLIVLLLMLSICATAHADFRGRRVGEVLSGLRSAGLTFIYNTQIVPDDLRVKNEPKARSGIELAREILADHGLSLSQAAPGVYAVLAKASNDKSQGTAAHPDQTASEAYGELVVQASRYALAVEVPASQNLVTHDQIQNIPRLADESMRAIQRLPGVATNGFSSMGAVRGGHPNEAAIVLDGLRLYEPFHLKNFLQPVSLLDSRLIDRLEFFSGGFPVIYGDRMSAIVNATSIEPVQPRYYELGANLFHLSALGSIRFADDAGSALISGRVSNLGDIVKLAENDLGEPNYWDGFGRVKYRFNDNTTGAAHLLASSDAIHALTNSGAEVTRARYRNVYAWTTLEHRWSERASSRLIASFTELANERRGDVNEPGNRVGRVTDDRLFHVAGLRSENDFDAGPTHHRFGIEIRRLWGRYNYASELQVEPDFPFPGFPGFIGIRAASPAPRGYESSAYWDARRNLGERWTVQGGMRVDTQTYDHSGDHEQWSPRVSLLYRLSPQTHLRASWGRFFQSQGINELQVEDGIDRFHPAQYADHSIVSLEHSFTTGLDLRIEAYRKDYRRLSPYFENLLDPLVMFPEAEFDRIRIDPRAARAEGMELLLNAHSEGPWRGWFGYTWSRTADRLSGQHVPRSWDQTHAIELGIVWNKGPWTVAATNSFHSGWPTTALELTPGSNGPQIVLDGRNRERFGSYDSLDLRLTRTFALRRGVLDTFLEANNALSRKNPCCARYTVTSGPGGSLIYSRDTDSWLPIIPSVGVLWRY